MHQHDVVVGYKRRSVLDGRSLAERRLREHKESFHLTKQQIKCRAREGVGDREREGGGGTEEGGVGRREGGGAAG